MINQFPYTSFNEVNLDWLAEQDKTQNNAIASLDSRVTALEAGGTSSGEEIYYCVYGTTTNADIEAALSNNMIPVCVYNDRLFVLSSRVSAEYHVFFSGDQIQTRRLFVGSNIWGNDTTDIAPIDSPTLTGSPLAPTPPYGDSSTRIATTNFVNKVRESVASVYSSTAAYAVGDYCWYSGQLYRFTVAHAAGAWTGSDAVVVKLSEDVGELRGSLSTNAQIVLTPTWTDGKYVAGNNVVIDNQSYSIADYDVTAIRGKVRIDTFGSSSVGWILLDSNNAQIERSLFTNSTGNEYNFIKDVDLRENASTLRVSCYSAKKLNHVVSYLVRDNDIVPILAVASTDFNDVPKNSVCTCEVGGLTTSTNHVPYDQFHGTILTLGQNPSSQQQFAISYHNRSFTRRKFSGTWSSWNELASITPLSATTSTDLNSVTAQFVNIAVSGMTVITNNVPYDGFQGQIYTIIAGTSFGSQIAVSMASEMWFRPKYVTWKPWQKVANYNTVETLENDYCILSEFDNIFCAGDSLTWGAVYTGSGAADYRAAKKPYNTVLGLRTGSTIARDAQMGIDAIGYVSKLASITEKTNQLCIIYLGTNGGLTDTIDTDAPGDDKSQYDLTTETGAYCYIVKHCLEVNAKVLLVKIYAGGGTPGVSTTNTVIGKVAEKFGVAAIENESLPSKYHIWPNGEGYDSTHLNDFGYAAFAEYLIRQVNQLEPTILARLLPS